jgi:single-stranded-DNA-specific exonuclease
MWHLEEHEEYVKDDSDEALERELEANPDVETWIFSKIAGVTFDNPDGVCRQSILPRCKFEDPLILEWERDNPLSKEALKLSRKTGEQLGYINARLAHDVLERILAGELWAVYIKEITGGTEDRPTLGANIVLVKFKRRNQ